MARLFEFIAQRKSFQNCVNSEISWNFFNYENNIQQYSNNNKNNTKNNNKNSNNIINNEDITHNSSSSYKVKPSPQHYHNNDKTNSIETNNSINNNNSNINGNRKQQQQHALSSSTTLRNGSCRSHALLQQQKLTTVSNKTEKCFITVDTETTTTTPSATTTISVADVTAYAGMTDATTLELKRKYHINNKLLHARNSSNSSNSSSSSSSMSNNNSSLDQRSMFYITLLVAFYCCVLIRASAATSANDSVANDSVQATAESATFFNATSTLNGNNGTSLTVTDLLSSNDVVALDDKLAVAAAVSSEVALQLHQRFGRGAANVPDDDDDSSYHDDEFDEYEDLINNKSAKGKYIGAPCDKNRCEPTLLHVTCDKETQLCGCQKNYPVQLGLTKGCAKPKKLGEQCFYDETCIYNDENSLCVQVRHNAKCQCASGFHSVSYAKPTRRVFCTQDLKELKSDLPTLLGVSSGIAVLAGLICMVLHLFSKTKYPRHRNFGDANLPPPIMYSSETVQSGRPSSRSSIRSSGSIGSYGNRRSSTTMQSASGHQVGGGGVGGGGGSSGGGSKGILVSTSRTGAARSAAILLISCHISELSKQTTRQNSRQTSGAGGSLNSRDTLDGDQNYGGGDTTDGTRSCESVRSMTRHLQRQLQHQRQLLSLELSPAKTKNHNKIRTMLGINGIDNYRTDDDDLNSLDNGNTLQIGALPTPASDTPRFAVIELY